MSYQLTLLLCFISLFGIGQDLKVKTITETKTNFLGNIISEHRDEFNPNGQLILRFVFDKSDQIASYRSYEYDSIGLLLKEIGFAKDDQAQEEWTYTYDEKGKLINQKRFYPLTKRTHSEHFKLSYNEDHQLIQKTDLDKDSLVTWQHNYYYNRKAELVKEESTYRDSVKTETTFKYKNGQLVQKILYDFDNVEKDAQENTQTYMDYDKSGKLIKKTVISLAEILKKPIITEEDYTYNKQGIVDVINRSNNGKFYSKTDFTYEFFY